MSLIRNLQLSSNLNSPTQKKITYYGAMYSALLNNIKVIIQSGSGSFNEQAIQALMRNRDVFLSPYSILNYIKSNGEPKDAMRMAIDSDCYASVAIENQISGLVGQTVKALQQYEISHVKAAVEIPIIMCLIRARQYHDQPIKRVFGHPQALKQIGQWHQKQQQAIELISVEMGATESAAQVAEHGESGDVVVGPITLTNISPQLELAANDIQDITDNKTLFALMKVKPRLETIPEFEAEAYLTRLVSEIKKHPIPKEGAVLYTPSFDTDSLCPHQACGLSI